MNIALVRRHASALGLILLAACVVRLAWALWIHPDPTLGWQDGDDPSLRRLDDTVVYRGAAHFIAQGEGFLNPFTGTPTAFWPPGYPAFLGAVFAAIGEGVWQTIAANIVLSLLTVVVVYLIGQRLFERRTALVAAGAVALWPGQVYFTSLTLSEPLFTFLFALGVLLVLEVPSAGRARAPLIVLFGLVAAAAALTRGQALLLIPLALVYWAFVSREWTRAAAWTALALVALALVFAPWVARNQQQLGSPVLIATNLGPNLWLGHHEGATGRMQSNQAIPLASREGRTQPEYEVASNELALKEGLAYIRDHPGSELRLSWLKIRALYEADSVGLDWNSGYSDGYYGSDRVEAFLRALANGYWFAALLLAGAGLVGSRAAMRGPLVMLPLLALGWTAAHVVFFGDTRFHYPIVFVVALLAARGSVVLFEALRRPQPTLRKRYAAA